MKNPFYKTEKGIAGVQFLKDKPVICGDSIRYIKEVTITWKYIPFWGNHNYRKAMTLEIEKIEKEFPEYKGFISIY